MLKDPVEEELQWDPVEEELQWDPGMVRLSADLREMQLPSYLMVRRLL